MLGLGNSVLSDYKEMFFDNFFLSFDGTDDYVDCDGIVSNISVTQGSISLWAKIDTTSSTGTLFRAQYDSNNYIQIIYHAGSNELRGAYKGDGTNYLCASDDEVEADGLWHHVVLTWNTDGGKIKLYVDKILEATKPNVGSPTEMTGEPTTADIGQNTSGSSYFKGNINDVAIYGSELSEAQVGVVYNNGNPKDETYETGSGERYLKVYFKFEEGSGTTATNIMETGVGRLTNGTAYEEH